MKHLVNFFLYNILLIYRTIRGIFLMVWHLELNPITERGGGMGEKDKTFTQELKTYYNEYEFKILF